MMAGMAATTMFGFFPRWLAELIWWVFVAVQFSFSYAITPKSVDIFADWSVRSRRFMGVGFSALGLLNLLTGLVLVWFNGIDLQLILIIIAGAGLLIQSPSGQNASLQNDCANFSLSVDLFRRPFTIHLLECHDDLLRRMVMLLNPISRDH
jgi:tellurite resistance protein TehA-like permease